MRSDLRYLPAKAREFLEVTQSKSPLRARRRQILQPLQLSALGMLGDVSDAFKLSLPMAEHRKQTHFLLKSLERKRSTSGLIDPSNGETFKSWAIKGDCPFRRESLVDKCDLELDAKY